MPGSRSGWPKRDLRRSPGSGRAAPDAQQPDRQRDALCEIAGRGVGGHDRQERPALGHRRRTRHPRSRPGACFRAFSRLEADRSRDGDDAGGRDWAWPACGPPRRRTGVEPRWRMPSREPAMVALPGRQPAAARSARQPPAAAAPCGVTAKAASGRHRGGRRIGAGRCGPDGRAPPWASPPARRCRRSASRSRPARRARRRRPAGRRDGRAARRGGSGRCRGRGPRIEGHRGYPAAQPVRLKQEPATQRERRGRVQPAGVGREGEGGQDHHVE